MLICSPLGAQTVSEQHLALVIGNAAYGGQPLRNPVNDAKVIAASLRKYGFAVIERTDASKKTMEDAILEFSEKLKAGGVGLFYYAGHGLQVRGHNYLVPVDANLPSEAAVRFQAVDVDAVLEQMAEARNRANVVILDACRNNPFQVASRGAPKGLAAIDAARGTLIAYSTAPGSVASDGDGANSHYTASLVRALGEPNLKVEEVFKQVRRHVAEATGGTQTPWESSSLTGDLIINQSATVGPAPQAVAPANRDAVEAAFWNSIAQSANAADFEDYMRQFPNGTFVTLAKRHIEEIKAKQQAAAEQQRKSEDERKRQAAEAEKQRLAAAEAERQRKMQPPPQTAAAPPPAPTTAAPPIIALDPGNVVECGFQRLQGLPINKSTVKCETKVEEGVNTHRAYQVAEFVGNGPNFWIDIYSRQHGAAGFTPLADGEFRNAAEKWASKFSPRNWIGPVATPVRHFRVNIAHSGENWACAYAHKSGRKTASGSDVEYAYIRYCEKGAHTLTNQSVLNLDFAIRFRN